MLQNAHGRIHIGQFGAVVQHCLPLAEHSGRKQWKRAVFRSLNVDLPAELSGAVNNDHREHLVMLVDTIL